MNKAIIYCFFFTLLSVNAIAQIGNQYFWRGTLIQTTKDKNQIYALVNDSLYLLNDKVYTFKNKISISTSNLVKIIVDSSNTFWFINSNSINYSKDEGKSWASITTPSNNISGVKLYGKNLYVKDYTKLYRINTSVSGSTWEQLYAGDRLQDFALSEAGTLFISEYMFAIYKSKDFGKTWEKTNWSQSIAFSTPGTLEIINNKLFVGTWWSGVFYSNDDGLTWTGSTLRSGQNNSNIQSGISKLIFNDKGLVFAYASDQQANRGYYFSSDYGVTFEKFNTGLSIWDEQFLSDLIIKNTAVYINAGYRGFFISSDLGKNWQDVNNGNNNQKPHHVCKLISNSKGHTYAFMALQLSIGRAPNSFWGIMKSVDSLKTWTYVSDNIREDYMSIQDLIINKDDHLIISGYNPGTILKSIDDGKTWVKTKINSIQSTVGFFGRSKNNQYGDTLYAGTWWDGVLRSIDKGETWTKLSGGLPTNNGGITSNQGSIDIFYYGDTVYTILQNQISYDGIYKSTDCGNNWSKLSSNQSEKILKLDSSLIISKGNTFYKSVDEGKNWSALTFSGNLTFSKMNQLYVYDSLNKIGNIKSSKVILATNNGLLLTNFTADSTQKLANNNITAFDYNLKQSKINFYTDGTINSEIKIPTIIGPSQFCVSESVKFSSDIANGTWSLEKNQSASIDSSGKLTVNSMGNYIINYTVKNAFGYYISSSKNIYVKPAPQTPSLSKDSQGNLLSSSSSNNYWFKDGILIDSLVNKYKPNANGNYTVKVLGSSCFSSPSNSYYYLLSGINNFQNIGKALVYPNPSKDYIIVSIESSVFTPKEILMFNSSGNIVLRNNHIISKQYLNIQKLPIGIYRLVIKNKTGDIIYSNQIVKY